MKVSSVVVDLMAVSTVLLSMVEFPFRLTVEFRALVVLSAAVQAYWESPQGSETWIRDRSVE